MGDEIAGLRLVHGALRLGLPSSVGGVVIGEHADDMDIVRVFEGGALGADKLAAKNEV